MHRAVNRPRWRRSLTSVAGVIAVLGFATLVPITTLTVPPAAAANPANGTVSQPNPSVEWHESSPLSGSAPSRRNQTCVAGGTPCDDFTLTIDRNGIPGDVKLTL